MSRDLRVLLVEDSADDAELILRTLRRGGFAPSYLRVESAEAMAAALQEGGWEIVLSDYKLPQFSGPAALELLKGTGFDLPFIVISGTVGEEVAVECMRAGASDFLPKGHLVRLPAAVLRELTSATNREAQRDGERQRGELELARERAVRESSFKSEFLATMSHELRTPLNAILGFSELLVDETVGTLNAKQTEYLELVLHSGRHLLNLINDFLDLSKIEAGRMELRLERCAVDQVVAEVISTAEPLADAKQIEISASFERALPAVAADLGRLRQVLFNLMSNAIKFTPAGGRVCIQGEPARNGAADGQVQVSVADTGIGVRREDQERIFTAFEQVDSPYARHLEGTGLGLALTRRLVELHGGRIWVESAGEGRGSTFRFTLPAGQGTAGA
jgi:signal transduction histidine kinase